MYEFYSEQKNAGKDEANQIKDDRLVLKGRRPLFKKIDRSLSLNFEGRVKKASRKNIQIVSLF